MYDLHMHTIASDGEFDAKVLCDKALELPLNKIAITDHDTFDSVKTAIKYCEDKDLKVIPGIEITCKKLNGKEIHIVGLNIDIENKDLKEYTQYVANDLIRRNTEMLEKFNEIGVDINEEDVYGNTLNRLATRRHFSDALIKKGYSKDQDESFSAYLKTEAFKDIKVEFQGLDTKDAIRLIHNAKGVAVLAHYQIYNLEEETLFELLTKLKSEGLDAIECYHGKMTVQESNYAKELANIFDLLKSIGSDFHGPKHNNIELGKGINGILTTANNKELEWVEELN